MLDYKEFAIVKETNAWITQAPPRRSLPEDSIAVFFNLEKILDTKSKGAAWAKVLELLGKCPTHVESEKDVLKRAIFG